jgi:hypothetical protein
MRTVDDLGHRETSKSTITARPDISYVNEVSLIQTFGILTAKPECEKQQYQAKYMDMMIIPWTHQTPRISKHHGI